MVPGMAPLVSVITPTWDRHHSLTHRCMPSVADQEYDGPIEHIIVSDGPDPVLEQMSFPSHVSYYQLPEHSPDNGRWGTKARLYGIEQSRGEYICYLDDDDKYRPHHIDGLVSLLEAAPDAGFAYSVGLWMNGDNHSTVREPFGSVPPIHGQIGTGTMMNRRWSLDTATWRDDGQQATIDWDLVERWLTAGMPYRFHPAHEVGTEFLPHPSEGFRY